MKGVKGVKKYAVTVSLALIFAGASSGDRLHAAEAGRVAPLEFVGTTPCGPALRAFVGGLPASSGCHYVAWRLSFESAGGTWKLAAAYGLPAPENPNMTVAGPRVALSGVLRVTQSARVPARTAFQLTSAGPARTLSLAQVGDSLLHVLAADGSLLVGTPGWSYTLSRADRVDQTDRSAPPPDLSYAVSPRATGSVFGIFEGRTPCHSISRELSVAPVPGCIKVKWRVTLHQHPQTREPAGYKIESSLHRERAREGRWSIVRGTQGDSSATVYRLEPVGREAAVWLLKADDNILYFLDQRQQLLIGNADFGYTLNRVPGKP